MPKPVDQVRAVVGFQYVTDRIFGSKFHHPLRDGKKKEIVVAKHDACGPSQRTDGAKHTEGIGPAVDKIADEPKTVAARIKLYMIEKTLQGIMAPLHIADCISRPKKCQRSLRHSKKRKGRSFFAMTDEQ